MIYAIAMDDQAICKIGYAADVAKRLSVLQVGTPFALRLIKSREGCRRLELEIQSRLSHLHVRGEWFKLTPETLEVFDDTVTPPHVLEVARRPQLLTDIRKFCLRNNMRPTRFGELALNDTAFVHKLEKGRRVWPETEAKARDFMATYEADRAA